MTGFEPGEVVLVAFPFTDLSTTKQRPAVVISSAAYALARPDLVILAITRRIDRDGGFAERPIADWRAAGLVKPSVLKPIIATVHQGIVRRRLGRLAPTDTADIGRHSRLTSTAAGAWRGVAIASDDPQPG